MAVLCYEVGADGYVCVDSSTTRNLIWVVARAVQQHHLVHENRRFHQAEQTRLQREQDEARRLLQEQRAAVEEFRAGPLREARPRGSCLRRSRSWPCRPS